MPGRFQTSLEPVENPQFVIGEVKKTKVQDTEATTSSSFISPPTTIKFTLDDVSKFLKPQRLTPQLGIKSTGKVHKEDTLSRPREPPVEELFGGDKEMKTTSSTLKKMPEKLFILESSEVEQSPTTPRTSTSLAIAVGGTREEPSLHIVEGEDENFKPSLSFPFLEDSTIEPQNLVTVDERRRHAVASFLQSQPIHYIEPESNVFPIKTIKIESEKSANDFTHQKAQGSIHLSKTPVPQIIVLSEKNEGFEEPAQNDETFSEEDGSSDEAAQTEKSLSEKNESSEKSPTIEKTYSEGNESSENVFQNENPLHEEQNSSEKVSHTEEPLATRKTLHFDQEFLALLKSYNSDEKKELKVESSSEVNPLWFSKGEVGGAWLWKGGARSPSSSTLPGVEAATQTSPLQKTLGGVFMASLRGLTSTTAKSVISVTPPGLLGEGPRVVSVGEVGEVPHSSRDLASSAPPLSAVLKHGVQSLNVSAWVSGCPKLYGKVQLNCATDTDAVANTAMSLMWKKKSFSEGRLKEQVVAEGDIVKVEDSRFSLQRRLGHYDLVIKDFRPKDCGTYECEARAADTVVASQLLLFTCL